VRAAIWQALKPRQPSPEQLVWPIRFLVALVVVVLILILLSEFGVVTITRRNALIVAAMLALTGVLSGHFINTWLENRRAREARDLENQRVEAARDLENQRAQDAREQEARRTALQKYFEQMRELIQQGLRESYMGDEKRTVARAQTSVVLRGLDPQSKHTLLTFLAETGLINRYDPIIDLRNANFNDAVMSEYLVLSGSGIDRSETSKYLGDANPSEYLSKDDLSIVLQNIDTIPDTLWRFLTQWYIRYMTLPDSDLPKVSMIKATYAKLC